MKEGSNSTENASENIKDAKVDFSLLSLAERILEKVSRRYGAKFYYTFGNEIENEEATEIFNKWLVQNSVSSVSKIGSSVPELKFDDTITCSAKLVTSGQKRSTNKPEKRKFSLVIKMKHDSENLDNLFLRENSFPALLNHELGTHLCRTVNEGLQPWYFNRERFNLCSSRSLKMLEIEEGLATINTTLALPSKELWYPALLYVKGCYLEKYENNVSKTVQKLTKYCDNEEFLYRLVKRGLNRQSRHDQCYFIGSVKLLRDRKNINFGLLMAGKLLPSEIDRISRVVRIYGLKIPEFMVDMNRYCHMLDEIAGVNFLD